MEKIKNCFSFLHEYLSDPENNLDTQVDSWNKNEIGSSVLEKLFFKEKTGGVLVPKHVYKDLEFFRTNGNKKSVFQSLCQTNSLYGKIHLKHFFKNPLCDSEKIADRQMKIAYFLRNHKTIQEKLRSLKKTSKNILWFWNPEKKDQKVLEEFIYFQTPFLHYYLNRSEYTLSFFSFSKLFLSPAFSLGTPLLCFLIPYLLFRYFQIPIPLTQIIKLLWRKVFTINLFSSTSFIATIISFLLWLFMYFYNTYILFYDAYITNKIINLLHTKLNTLAQVYQVYKECRESSLAELFSFEEEDSFERMVLHSCIRGSPSLLSNKGKILATFTKIRAEKEKIISRISLMGKIDAFASMATYLRQIKSLPWCYAQLNAEKDNCKSFWHPILAEKSVVNNFHSGKKTRVHLITGGNASGKSTYVRTYFLNALVVQCFGIALAKSWQQKHLYTYMNTYLNIPDAEGEASLFEAQMARCQQCLELAEKHISLIIMDEVFSSTNPKEGIAATYAILEHFSKNKNNLRCLVTTHFHELCALERNTRGRVRNLSTEIKEGQYTFQIKRGVSKDHKALGLLEKKGFSKDILERAKKFYTNKKETKSRPFGAQLLLRKA